MRTILWSYALLLFVMLHLYYIDALIDCDDVISQNNEFTGKCNNKWKFLKPLIRPTQSEVGYAWIGYKLVNIFYSENNAQDEMDSSPLPAVIGPDLKFYIVDDHHTISTLDYSGYDDTVVTVNVVCDKRKLSIDNFWLSMEKNNLVNLVKHQQVNDLPVKISPLLLPNTFSFNNSLKVLKDDPWRSLAGFSRKVNYGNVNDDNVDYPYRCMYRGCSDGSKSSGFGVPFFEFKWAYYMNDASIITTSLWPTSNDYKLFLSSFLSIEYTNDIDNVDTDAWLKSASLVVPLCRADSVGKYTIPSNLYSSSTENLPGYVVGYIPLEDDPDCLSPVCY